ncbi:hypothetical protein AMR42_03900 [Limnothrix sp. PR1529]|nr:hypothetical protein BCR12_16680 [Limnothrix sp. P13C2]PIB14842.1 hypothetical protein AMR42_03900 [Limnothrix sp. PR1529]
MGDDNAANRPKSDRFIQPYKLVLAPVASEQSKSPDSFNGSIKQLISPMGRCKLRNKLFFSEFRLSFA